MIPRISLLIASLHVVLYLWLSFRVIGQRKRARIGIGSGGDDALARAIRVHGNFGEYVPMALLMLALLEWSGLAPWLLWVFGLALLAARILHALGLAATSGYSPGRFAGALLTFIAMAAMAAAGIWRFTLPALA